MENLRELAIHHKTALMVGGVAVVALLVFATKKAANTGVTAASIGANSTTASGTGTTPNEPNAGVIQAISALGASQSDMFQQISDSNSKMVAALNQSEQGMMDTISKNIASSNQTLMSGITQALQSNQQQLGSALNTLGNTMSSSQQQMTQLLAQNQQAQQNQAAQITNLLSTLKTQQQAAPVYGSNYYGTRTSLPDTPGGSSYDGQYFSGDGTFHSTGATESGSQGGSLASQSGVYDPSGGFTPGTFN